MSDESLQQAFIAAGGSWDASWAAVGELDAGFLRRYIELASVPRRKNHLDATTRELIGLAVNAAVTHLHVPAMRGHIRAALAEGATTAEVMEVLECTATLSIHAMNVGVPVLVEVLSERGIRTGPAELDDYQLRLKAEFTAGRGYWNSTWDELLELDPELFEAYTDFSSHPWRTGTLSPKMRELIYIAFDTSATHLYRVGLKLHIENAIGYGATVAEILAVMEIAAMIGVQSVVVGAPLVLHEAAQPPNVPSLGD